MPTSLLALGYVSKTINGGWGTQANGTLDSIDDKWTLVTPSTQAFGDSATGGASLRAARADHKHAFPTFTFAWPDANLLINPSFNIWDDRQIVGPVFPGWQTYYPEGQGGYGGVASETTLTDNSSGAIHIAAPNAPPNRTQYLGQNLLGSVGRGATGVPCMLAGQTLYGSIRAKTAFANSLRTFFAWGTAVLDSFASSTIVMGGAFHPGDNAYHTLSQQFIVPRNATWVKFGVKVEQSSDGTSYLDNACVVISTQQVDYIPRHPAQDRQICQGVQDSRAFFQSKLMASDGVNYRVYAGFVTRYPNAAFLTQAAGAFSVYEDGSPVNQVVNYINSNTRFFGDNGYGGAGTGVGPQFGVFASKAVGGSRPFQISALGGVYLADYSGFSALWI